MCDCLERFSYFCASLKRCVALDMRLFCECLERFCYFCASLTLGEAFGEALGATLGVSFGACFGVTVVATRCKQTNANASSVLAMFACR